MKKLLFIPLLLSLGLIISLSSCETKTTDDNDTTSTAETKDGTAVLIEDKRTLRNCEDMCGVTGTPVGVFDVSSECYQCMMDNYAVNGYMFSPYDGHNLEGFQINHGELNEILQNMNDPATATVHIMMGIMNEESVPHAVFAVKDEGTFSYYDFTNPCPTYCAIVE